MTTQLTAKTFKSGNSVALRLPAALGIKPGQEWKVTMRDGEMIVRAADAPKRKFNVAKVAGCLKDWDYTEPASRAFEPRRAERNERD